MKPLVGVTKCSVSDWFNDYVYLMDSLMSSWCLEIFLKIYSSKVLFQFTCLSASAKKMNIVEYHLKCIHLENIHLKT